MAAGDVRIVCFNPAHEGNYDFATIYTREMRSGLRWSSTVPGGDASASWTVSCDRLAEIGYPAKKARILIDDPVRGTFLWRGVLKTPKPHYERGKLASVDFEAVGVAEASFRQFPTTTVFGLATTQATVIGRQVITNLGEAMAFGLTITPLVDGVQTHIAVGPGAPDVDTSDFRGNTAPGLWQEICNLTAFLEQPYIWMVYPDAAGAAALHFLATPSTAEYFEHGQSKKNDLEIDYGEIANLIYVAYQGNDTIYNPDVPNGDPIDYTNTPDIQTHFVNVTEDIRDLSDATGYAGQLLNKFNREVVTGGTILLDRDIRTLYTGTSTPVMIPVYEVRAGKVIQTEITKIPYLSDSVVNVLIMSAEYDEDNCEVTLSPSALPPGGRDARKVTLLSGRSSVNWGTLSRQLGTPHPSIWKEKEIVVQTDVGFFGKYFDPSTKAVPSVYPQGWTNGAGVLSGTSAPLPVTNYPAGGDKPLVVLAEIPIAVTDEGKPGYGTLGGKILPQAVPDERINIPAQFSTSDPLTGALTDGERMHTDAQEGFIETFTISVLDDTDCSVTVNVDIYNWDQAAVRVSLAFTLALSGGHRVRYIYNDSDNAHRPVLLLHGDQLIWSVESPDTDVILNCCLSGWKSWGEFPVLVGPNWIPGNA